MLNKMQLINIGLKTGDTVMLHASMRAIGKEAARPNDLIQSILDVIVHQNAFFASTKDAYGHLIPDVGSLLLSVTSNGQYKQVTLYGKPATALDEQTRHVFAIRDFLLNYHPATTLPYTPPGIALLVIPQEGENAGVPAWPIKISRWHRPRLWNVHFFHLAQ